jgi:hypothetical protein
MMRIKTGGLKMEEKKMMFQVNPASPEENPPSGDGPNHGDNPGED